MMESAFGNEILRTRKTQAYRLMMNESAVQKIDEWMRGVSYDIVKMWDNSVGDSFEYLVACWFLQEKKMQFIRIFSIGGKAHLSVDWELYPSDFT